MNLIEIMKTASIEAAEQGKPPAILQGTVISTAPLKVQIDQKLILTKEFLLLPRNVTDFELDVAVAWSTADASGPESHSHGVGGKKKMTVHNALRTGEGVILIRVQGGQKYLVLDRVGVAK